MKTLFIFVLLIFTWACASPNRFPDLISTDEKLVWNCDYLDTISELSDPGRLLPRYQANDAELKILERADRLGATHLVWLYNYRIGSAASVYCCGGY